MNILSQPTDRYRSPVPKYRFLQLLISITSLVVLYLAYAADYVLFHTLVELFSIVIGYCAFVVAWNTRRFLPYDGLLVIGVGYGCAATIDLLHTLAYKDLNLFPGFPAQLTVQFWIAGRYMQAATLFVAPIFLKRRINTLVLALSYYAASLLLIAMVFSGLFPDCFIEGQGMTPFKINSEYIIIVICAISLGLFYKNRQHLHRRVYLFLTVSIACVMAAEMMFTAWSTMYDFMHMAGHMFKLATFYLTYRALLATGLSQPFELIFRDLKQTEEALRLQTTELAAAKEQAETANRAKSVFLANMSHELRTPLNAVLGFSHLMKNATDVTAKQRENLDIITRSGEHLLTLINNVLDISKIESGRVELEEAPIDLGQLLNEIKSLMYVPAHEKGLDFTLEQSPDLPRHIAVDGGKLRQVLLNLIGNAIKYTELGGVTLRAVARRQETAGRVNVRFEVSDTGPGIREEDKERIFFSFVQLGEQPPTEAGTGLGLAISKQYVELMGGEIGVAGEPGKGSVFHFEIPVKALSPETMIAAPRRGRVIGPAEGQPRYRLLIAEDQAENRLLLRKLLEPLGFDLRVAVNGQEAVAIFEHWHPHLIWMDIRMPVMDGLEATRQIKATKAGAQTKIIAVTAHALEEERREILAAGCDGCIRKPYHDFDIVDALTQHLGVRFVYEKEPIPPTVAESLDAATLADLPDELLNELEQALVRLDIGAVNHAIEGIRAQHPSQADALEAVAWDLQFGQILRTIRAAADKAHPKDEICIKK